MLLPVNQVIVGDCAKVMATFPDNCIDLTVTSPPYDDLRNYNGYSFEFESIAQQLYRVTKVGGVVVWVVGDSSDKEGETGTSFRQALYFKEIGFNLHDTMIYMKAGPSYPSPDKYFQVFDYMFVLCKGIMKTFNPISDRVNRWYGEKWSKVRTRRTVEGDLIRSTWSSEEGGKIGKRFNIWQYAGGAKNQGDAIMHQHPATFPEALANDHILSWSNPGDIVLDPLAGSGTTLKMAKELGRQYLGIEISQKYVEEIINPRLEATNIPFPMFSLENHSV